MFEAINENFKNWKRLRGMGQWMGTLVHKRPVLVNLEVTKACNAKCGFCVCWTIKEHPQLQDYGPVIERIKPVVVSINGGEPLLRKDIVSIVKQVKPYCAYTAIISNGALMTEEKAWQLIDAGLDQITFSIDYFSEKHDDVRHLPGVFRHLCTLIPSLVRRGFKNVVINTILMDSNLDDVVKLARQAHEWGVKISFSAFSAFKADNQSGLIQKERLGKLGETIDTLRALKEKNHNIMSSDYFFEKAPIYFEKGGIGTQCMAGIKWVTVTPDGYIQPCSELGRVAHYTDYEPRRMKPVDCDVCFYSCRAESESPITLKRVAQWIRQ